MAQLLARVCRSITVDMLGNILFCPRLNTWLMSVLVGGLPLFNGIFFIREEELHFCLAVVRL